MSLSKFVYYIFVKRIKEIRLMEFVNYVKKDVDSILEKELNWQFYGGHHHESYFTHFFQSYYLPVKFNIDKRKVELSAMIRSGHIKKDEALQELESEYPYQEELIKYVCNKFEFTQNEFKQIMNDDKRTFRDFKTYHPLIKKLKLPIKIAADLHMVPKILYEKYAK